MNPHDKLFALIHSLTPAEKSYFTKYSRLNSTKEKPDYLLLFEFLDNAKTYDEAAIKKRFKHEKFINHLPRKKTQIKDKILESLTHYHANHTVEASLRLQMNLLPTLREKASKNKILLKEFENQIKSIKKQAKEAECFGILADLFTWERHMLGMKDNNKEDKNILSLLEERGLFITNLNKEVKLEEAAIHTQLLVLKDPKIKLTKNREVFRDSVIDVLDNYKPEDLSRMAKRYYFYAKTGYHCFFNQSDLAHDVAKKMIETYSEKDIENPITLKYYKQHLCRYLVLSYHADNFDHYSEVIAKLEAISSDSDDLRMFNKIQFKMLVYYLSRHEFKKAMDVVQKIERRWDDLCNFIERRRQLAYCYNIMITYWFNNETDTTFYWLSKILNFENVQRGQAFISAARIMQIPMYYDINDVNLENKVDSTRKVLKKREELNEYRQLILSGFRRLIRCVDKKEENECIADIYQNLFKIKDEKKLKEMDLEGVLLWSKLKIAHLNEWSHILQEHE